MAIAKTTVCTCISFPAVAVNLVANGGCDQHGTQWGNFLTCPGCGKRRDARNRLLRLGFQREGIRRWMAARTVEKQLPHAAGRA